MYHGQTLKAWRIFEDCEEAIDKLEHSPDPESRRVQFASAVVLLHAIGNVLVHTDAIDNPVLRHKLDSLSQDIESNRAFHKLYWNFIKPEHEQVLRECNLTSLERQKPDSALLLLSPEGDLREERVEDYSHAIHTEVEESADLALFRKEPDQLQEALFAWYELLCNLEFYLSPCIDGYVVNEIDLMPA